MFCMQFQEATGVLGPFATLKLTIIWQPKVPGRTVNNFVLSFDNEAVDDVSYYFCWIMYIYFSVEFSNMIC